jgi:hypothetical protein
MALFFLPFTIFEVRFTPAGHERTLIGAGRERREFLVSFSDGIPKWTVFKASA